MNKKEKLYQIALEQYFKSDKYLKTYSPEMVRTAVDIVIGDDGFRSKEVIDILDNWDNKEEPVVIHDAKNDILKLIDKVDSLEQNIINIDAKYNRKLKKMGGCKCKVQK